MMQPTHSSDCRAAAQFNEEILEDYPDLERDDILAAIEYAAHQTDHMVLQGV
jgi:uncharacterized protein (DUF433 family)